MYFCNWFRRKPKTQEVSAPKLGKRTKKIIYKTEARDIGLTFVKLTFEGGKTLTHIVYGNTDQYTNYGHDAQDRSSYGGSRNVEEPSVSDISIVSSKDQAKHYMTSFPTHEATYVDNERSPKKARIGKVVAAEVIRTDSFHDVVSVAYVVQKEEGDV